MNYFSFIGVRSSKNGIVDIFITYYFRVKYEFNQHASQ